MQEPPVTRAETGVISALPAERLRRSGAALVADGMTVAGRKT
jgi:uncharacterized protein YjeT (DUF2065 family)